MKFFDLFVQFPYLTAQTYKGMEFVGLPVDAFPRHAAFGLVCCKIHRYSPFFRNLPNCDLDAFCDISIFLHDFIPQVFFPSFASRPQQIHFIRNHLQRIEDM
jgi:hypothetical protein